MKPPHNHPPNLFCLLNTVSHRQEHPAASNLKEQTGRHPLLLPLHHPPSHRVHTPAPPTTPSHCNARDQALFSPGFATVVHSCDLPASSLESLHSLLRHCPETSVISSKAFCSYHLHKEVPTRGHCIGWPSEKSGPWLPPDVISYSPTPTLLSCPRSQHQAHSGPFHKLPHRTLLFPQSLPAVPTLTPSFTVGHASQLLKGSSLWTLGSREPIHIPIIAPVGDFPLEFSLWIPLSLLLTVPSTMSSARKHAVPVKPMK